jgi:hypothetical protein
MKTQQTATAQATPKQNRNNKLPVKNPIAGDGLNNTENRYQKESRQRQERQEHIAKLVANQRASLLNINRTVARASTELIKLELLAEELAAAVIEPKTSTKPKR